MAGLPSSPDTRHWATRDPREAAGYLTDLIGLRMAEIDSGPSTFGFELSGRDCGGFIRGRLGHRATVVASTEPYDGFLVGQLMAGRLALRAGTEPVAAAPGDVVLYPRHQEVQLHAEAAWFDGVRLARSRVADAAVTAGLNPDRVLLAARPVTSTMQSHWRRTLDYVDDVGVAVDLQSNPLVGDQLGRLLSTTLLAAFGRGVPAPRERGRIGSGPVRRVIAYVEAHADEPIGLTELARIADVGPRALQAAFRRRLDLTPLEYVRRVRLERAHRDLLAADPARGDTVAAVAARWGFVHLGRFAAAHRAAYGQSPRSALRR